MSSNWSPSILGEFVEHQKGLAFKSREYQKSGHPIVRVSNFTSDSIDMSDCNFIAYSKVKEYGQVKLFSDDVVIATVGSWAANPNSVVGKVVRVPKSADNALLNQNAVRLRTIQGLDQDFLFYLLKTQEFQNYIIGTARGSANQASITLEAIFNFSFFRPLESKQKEIAQVLKGFDKKIELNRRMNRTLEAMAEALFKSWFVDFDPVHAKAEGREPVGMDAETAALLPSRFEPSKLGEIPRGWHAGTVKHLCTFQRISVKPYDFPNDAFIHYSIPAFDDRKHPIVERGKDIKSNKHEVPEQAVLISKLNPRFPRIWIPEVTKNIKNVCSTEFLVMVSIDGLGKEYIYSLFQSASFLRDFQLLASGTSGSHQRVKPKDFLDMKCVVPNSNIRQKYIEVVKPLLSKVTSNQKEIDVLSRTRDALLPQLLLGKLAISESYEPLEASL